MAKPKKSTTKRSQDEDLFRIATFILFDACVFHESLASHHSEIKTLAAASTPLQRFLANEWKRILKIDYEPIFLLAREILNSFPSSPTTEEILGRIRDEAEAIVSSGILLRHDFMGRLYHKLLLRTTGQYYATYYTSIPTASLLAAVAVRAPNPGWDLGSLASIGRFRAIDPACGSGTLLSAAYTALKDAYIRSRPNRIELHGLHKVLVENVIHGWDVLDFAAHLSLTTLALHSNRTTFDSSHVFTLPFGATDPQQVHLGSLDYLDPQTRMMGLGFSKSSIRHGLAGRKEETIEPPACDLVIMNPPFSRSANPNVKFGFSNKATRELMSKELSALGRSLEMSGIGQAGLGAYFLLLGRKLVKMNGRVAFVLPRSMLSGVSWAKVRALYVRDFEIEYVISNYDPGESDRGIDPWSWSENTDLGEVLVVARRAENPASSRVATYINLWNKPANEVESLLMGKQIIDARTKTPKSLNDGEWNSLTLGEKAVGVAYQVAQKHLAYNWLNPCVFARPRLNRLSIAASVSKEDWVPFENLCTGLGVDIKQVKDNFVVQETETAWPMVWGHQQDMNRMAMQSQHVGFGREKKGERSGNLHEAGASRFLVAERPHLRTESLLAFVTEVPVLTTAFWEVRLREESWLPFFLLWFNSTYGAIRFLAASTSSQGDIFKMKKDQLSSLLVPDPTDLDHDAFAELYAEVCEEVFEPYASEFKLGARNKGVRWRIDNALRESLGLDRLRRETYSELASDPVVTCVRL